MEEFDTSYKDELINIIKKSLSGKQSLNNRETAILFHWVRNVNDPAYDWVPEKYKLTSPHYSKRK